MPATIQSPPPAVEGAKTETAPQQEIYSAASEIDELDIKAPDEKPEVTPPPKKEQKPAPEEPEAEEEPQEEEEETPNKKAGEEIDDLDEKDTQEKPKEEPEKKPEEKFGKMKDLKVVYEKTKAEKKELETKLAEASKTIETLKRSNPDEVRALTDRLTKAETRRDELEQEMRHINYQGSEEFKTRYQKPYEDAWVRATKDLSELTVEMADGASRKATPEDLARLANMPLGEARRTARDIFGEAADDVMAHRRKILDLSEAQDAALQESRKAAKERDQTRIVEERTRGEKLRGVYGETVTQIADKYPRLFKPVPGDDEGNQLLERGFSEVDRFFNDTNMPMEERVKLHAMLRFRAGGFDRMQLRMVRMSKQLQQARADLQAYEKSQPPGGGKLGARKAKESSDVFAQAEKEIEALDEQS